MRRWLLLGVAAGLPAPVLLAAIGAVAGSGDIQGLQGLDIPPLMLEAYMTASYRSAEVAPACEVRWTILAGIGKVESNHGRTHGDATEFEEDGDVRPPIVGPTLDGSGDVARVPDTDRGVWDRDRTWDHAVEPMQFFPSTWRQYGRDGSGDGKADPHNAFDAALGAVAKLCLGTPGNYAQRSQLARALRAYNPSEAYVQEVLRWIETYDLAMQATSVGVAAIVGDGPLYVCPVHGPHNFSDDYGVPRPGGRTHQGNDIFAPYGTPVVAPFAGRAEATPNSLGGLAVTVYGDEGYAYNAHLSAYGELGLVEAGTVIGHVGTSGNAVGTPPHDHFEWHPGGGEAVNPFPFLSEVC